MNTCTPVTTYFTIALVISIITIIIHIIQSGMHTDPIQLMSMSCSQLCLILICTSILGYICQQFGVNVTWILVALWIICGVLSCTSALVRVTKTYFK